MTRLSDLTAEPNEADDPETRIQRSPRDYLDEPADIGRPVGNHTRELFVACEPALALAQQFDYLRPGYVALHDIACQGAKRMLHAVASAAGRPVERLVIRRQGYGTTLAAADHVDCPAVDGRRVRLYSTDIDTDTPSRTALARVLLTRAALSVVLVGDVPAHAMGEALQPLREPLFGGSWRCPHLVFLPLSAGSHAALAGLVGALGLGSGVQCRMTAPVTRPADAWTLISQSWNAAQAAQHPDGRGAMLADFAPGREVLEPMPPTGAARRGLVPGTTPIDRFVLEAHALAGVQAVCVFDVATSRVLRHVGAGFQGTDLARRGSLLLAAGTSSRRQLHLAGIADEVLVGGGVESLGVRALQSQPGLAMHLIYNPAQTSWTHLRPRLMALDAALPRAPVL